MVFTLPSGEKAIVDDSDGYLFAEFNWHIVNGYVQAEIGNRKNGTRKHVRLHRLVMNPPESEIVDHISGNKLDNRRCNLRIATKSSNGFNRRAQLNSKTGVKGVCWSKQAGKFRVYCSVKGRQYHLGFSESLEKAAEIYAENIHKYHGEFACV